jgi:hypothetical protein
MDPMVFTPGMYTVRAVLYYLNNIYDYVDPAITFEVMDMPADISLGSMYPYLAAFFKVWLEKNCS